MNSNVKIFASVIEDEARKQINGIAQVYDKEQIRIMPDVHAGKGCTIGTTIKLIDKVTPNMVGVDIGCGMLCVVLGHISIDFKKLDEVIDKYIPCGFKIHELSNWMFSEAYIKSSFYCSSNIDVRKAILSNGTLGGGNHFIEIDEDETGCKYLVIHTGSRHLGVEVCRYYQNIAIKNMSNHHQLVKDVVDKLKSEGRYTEIQDAIKNIQKQSYDKDLAYLTGKDMDNYLHDMEAAQEYAHFNREQIGRVIREKMGFHPLDVFETIHNYIDTDNMILRKGAVDASKGKKLLIPMNMRDGSLICVGKGNEDWNCSAPHGSGRLMSRTKAKEAINLEDFKKSMVNVYSTSVCESTIDESPFAYKDSNELINLIEPTVSIQKNIKAIYNFKAK